MDLKLTTCILCVVSIIGHTEHQLVKDLHAVFGNLALSKSNVLSMVQSTAARAYNSYKSCINVTTRNNCTSEKAYFFKNFIKAGVSYGKCGAQTNPFFSDYAGKIQCPSDAANDNVTQTPSGGGQSRGTTHTNGSGLVKQTLATLLITVAFVCISL
ncbi:hypothetical protein MAR_037103 [Mya arenaria]|uniref:Uncharacterized protein n=1 Tax=Mya arenaria TaxID=6604 RepID=A0ABY7FRF1_MYAAR|nr:hypothetical protein MAR_037103 [Mya arenaria]